MEHNVVPSPILQWKLPHRTCQWQPLQYSNTLTEEEDLSELIITDSGASTNLFCKREHLQNVRRAQDPLVSTPNARTIKVEEQGDLPGYAKLLVHESAVTNIFALANLCKKFRWHLTVPRMKPSLCTLLIRWWDLPRPNQISTPTSLNALQLKGILLSRQWKRIWTFIPQREVQRAKKAESCSSVAWGSPSVANLKAAIAINGIANLPVTTTDVDLAEKIFGKDIGIIKGKTTSAIHRDCRVRDSIPDGTWAFLTRLDSRWHYTLPFTIVTRSPLTQAEHNTFRNTRFEASRIAGESSIPSPHEAMNASEAWFISFTMTLSQRHKRLHGHHEYVILWEYVFSQDLSQRSLGSFTFSFTFEYKLSSQFSFLINWYTSF